MSFWYVSNPLQCNPECDLHTQHSVHIQILNSINYYQNCLRRKEVFDPTLVDMWPKVGSGLWVAPVTQLHIPRPRKAQNIQSYPAPILGFPHGVLYALAYSVWCKVYSVYYSVEEPGTLQNIQGYLAPSPILGSPHGALMAKAVPLSAIFLFRNF